MPERKKKKSLKNKKRTTVKAKKAKASVRVKRTSVPKKEVKASSKAKPVAGDLTLSVYELNGHKSQETITIDPLFSGEVNTDVVYQAILMYRAGEREGTASTKERGAVRGGGKKPWKQKGTGQARHGSRRSPIWRGGGTTFGPEPRDYSYSIPVQLRKRAVVEVVKDKVLNKKVMFLNRMEMDTPKTKGVMKVLKALKLEKPLFLVEKKSQNLLLGSRNIPGVSIKSSAEVNALDVASHHECVMTKAAYEGLLKRLKS